MTQDVVQPIDEQRKGQRHLERLVMLSDGIFAIAITLSAIEIKPELDGGVSLWQAWWPSLLIYFFSFFLIGLVWMEHRRIVSLLRDIDGPGTVINMLLLSMVALMPVVVRFVLTHHTSEGSFLVYGLAFVSTYGCMALLWGYAAFVAKLAPDVPRATALALLCKLGFTAMLFAALTMYAAGMMIGAVICALMALPLRWVAWKQGRTPAMAT